LKPSELVVLFCDEEGKVTSMIKRESARVWVAEVTNLAITPWAKPPLARRTPFRGFSINSLAYPTATLNAHDIFILAESAITCLIRSVSILVKELEVLSSKLEERSTTVTPAEQLPRVPRHHKKTLEHHSNILFCS
jgi:hypothetical protein